jgi:hypothetical protein
MKKKFDQKLEKLVINYNSYFLNISKIVNLNEKWNIKNSFELEIKKSFIRGVLRYSTFSSDIIKIVKKNFREEFPSLKKIKWITLPYPMVHLSNDKAEFGGYHVDGQKDENLLTCWLPISNYNYPAISIFHIKKNNFFIKYLLKKFPILFSKVISKIIVKQGDIFFWGGNLLHTGNLNTSDNISCAIQLKLSENIYDFEFCQNIDDETQSIFMNFDNISLKNLFDKYFHGLTELNSNSKIKNLFENSAHFAAQFVGNSLPISFGLSVLSQRLISRKFLFDSNYTSKSFIENMDIASLMLGSSNLISLKRLLEKNTKKLFYLQNLRTFDINKSIPFDSYQFKKIANI